MKYIAKKYDQGLLGRDAEEMARADMLSRVHDTLYDQIGVHFKNGDPEEFNRQIDIVAQNLATYFKKGSKRFATGDNLTFADFSLFELLDFMNFYSGG